MKNMVGAIMLDFDGVIAESVDVKTGAFREIFSRYTDNVEPVVSYHLQNNGISRFIKFRHIWENILMKPYDKEVELTLGKEFSAAVTEKVVNSPFVGGALDFLNAYYKIIPLYVASAVPEEELKTIVERKGIGKYFTGLYGYPPTTKSEAIRDVMRRQSVDAGNIVFIGDSHEDMKAANDMGAIFLARHNKENFDDTTAPLFYDLNGILKYISENLEVRHEGR